MLKLKEVKKVYELGENKVNALRGINVNFRKSEFVAILGESGGGKSTLLNIIGGLDNATSGDLVIDGKSIKDFKMKDYDSYRNNSIGFVFQNYNLISHLTVFDNVAMAMTLNGKSKRVKEKKVKELLKKVGISDQINKKPSQLSGGQQQRVAIARALSNDPKIILADEPTGALDSVTSAEIIELIKKISEDKLVIMVTHSEEIAKNYANRIIKIKDGEIIDDTNSFEYSTLSDKYTAKRPAMKFSTSIKLSFNNIRTKKFRTFLTSFALSIGIIGIALVMSVNNGFSKIIGSFESKELSGIPLMIINGEQNLNVGINTGAAPQYKETEPIADEITIRKPSDLAKEKHVNNIDSNYLEYLEQMDSKIYNKIHKQYLVKFNMFTKSVDNKYIKLNLLNDEFTGGSVSDNGVTIGSLDFSDPNQIENYYKLVTGELAKNHKEIVLVVKPNNQLSEAAAISLGYDSNENINFESIIGKKLYIPTHNDYYVYSDIFDTFVENKQIDSVIGNEETIELTITGVLVEKKEGENPGYDLIHHHDLEKEVLKTSVSSELCVQNKKSPNNIFSNSPYTSEIEKNLIEYSLGCKDDIPYMINVSYSSIANKEAIKAYLDEYNEDKTDNNQIQYMDVAKSIVDTIGSFIDVISISLIVFASISLVVSSIMIGIIMYISVLERTKEIGVLKALGARQKDIRRVFSSESIIIGAIAGLAAIVATLFINIIINAVVKNLQPSFDNIAQLAIGTSIYLIILSVIITLIGGIIPAIIASKKNPVEALRSE